MTLKDWKKTKNQKFSVVYKTKDRSDAIHIFKKPISQLWGIDFINKPLKYEKYFKTKLQALKFAKSYMKKH